ncbi:hypothetical protein H8356DRAFT_940996 [Neocallimastix lanati (nom. inval.)]|jgi:hypothetical protein|nr:hypothetical protein H8356DRAFT_940996 [Neocallimastix sp. JGI-2020a]
MNYIWIKLNIILILLLIKVYCDEGNNNIKAPPGAIQESPNYCTQFNRTTVFLDLNKVNGLDGDQFVSSSFSLINPNEKLDYYIRYILASRGVCFYEEGQLKEINKWDILQVNGIDDNNQPVTADIRYTKTTLCSYFYDKYKFENEVTTENSLKEHLVCKQHCTTFLTALYFILSNREYCKDPTDTMEAPPDVYQRRNELVNNLNNFCQNLPDGNCKQLDNFEVANCGFGSVGLKEEYCKIHNNEECCDYTYSQIKTEIKYKLHNESIITGVSVASVFVILGSYFSAKYIKEIKIQESIKRSVLNQEKEFHESNKQLLQDAYNQGFDPNKQTFNSNSRNLNNAGTLRPKANPVSTMNSYGSSQRGTMATGGRYPQNSYQVSQDYTSTDERDISLRRGMIVQLIQKYEGGWLLVKDINSNRQGYAPEYCLGNKVA